MTVIHLRFALRFCKPNHVTLPKRHVNTSTSAIQLFQIEKDPRPAAGRLVNCVTSVGGYKRPTRANVNQAMELLAKCSCDRAVKVVHGVIDKICGHSSMHYKEVSDLWSLEEWWSLNDSLLHLIKQRVNASKDSDAVDKAVFSLPADHQQDILEAINIRLSDIKTAFLEATTQISESSLSDFDWQLKMTMASDSMSSLHQLLVNVDFHLNPNNETTSVELDESEMTKLIQSLDAANKVLMQMKS